MMPGKRYSRPDRMQPDEFERRCESVWGKYWRHAASRALRRDAKMMTRYATGDCVVPDEVARRLLSITEIGPVAEVVKQIIIAATLRDARERKHERISLQETPHFLAVEVLSALKGANLIGPMG
jgi:hypothetical protein